MSRNVLLIKVEELKAKTAIGSNVEDKLLVPEIRKAQDMYLEPLLGSALYTRLQDGIVANDLSADEVTLRTVYIADTLIQYTLSLLPLSMNYQFFNMGAKTRTSEHSESPSMSDLFALANKYQNDAEWYAQRLITYLVNNRETFTEYETSSDNDLNPQRSGFTMNIDLDDDYPTCSEDYG